MSAEEEADVPLPLTKRGRAVVLGVAWALGEMHRKGYINRSPVVIGPKGVAELNKAKAAGFSPSQSELEAVVRTLGGFQEKHFDGIVRLIQNELLPRSGRRDTL